MTVRLNAPLRVAAVAAASALVGISFLPAASAADGDVEVVNTETIQVYTDATGKVQTKRVYEQVSMTGNGSVELVNPIETDGLRNLDEFGGFDVRDGNQVTTMTVDGEKRLRSVSDYDGDLPLTVDVQYFLDGTKVEPGDVVGAEGRLEVLYTVTNVTAQPQEVSFPDGNGGTVSKTVDVPIPMVGSLSTVAPDNFTDVQSDQANMAGDGRGGTKLSFTMTLFPPLGADSVEFGYSANITDGVVPRAEISALPLNPLESPTFQTAATSYQSGADTGAQLADGAATIDENLLKLRDGASELLAGLIRLRDGSAQLEQGLAGEAAPGAAQLADGASQLSAGLGEIDSGAGELAAGAGRLSDGVGQLADGANRLDAGAGRLADGTTELLAGTGELMTGAGRLNAGAKQLAAGTGAAAKGSKELAAGATQLESGLTQLDGGVGELGAGASRLAAGQASLEAGLKQLHAGVAMLPSSVQQSLQNDPQQRYASLLEALQSIADGIGTRNDPPTASTLLGGLNKIEYGMRNPLATDEACDAKVATHCGVTDGLERIAERVQEKIDETDPTVDGSVAKLKATILSIKTALGEACDLACQVYIETVAGGVELSQQDALAELRDGILAISGGIDQQLLTPNTGGLDRLRFGLSNPAATDCVAGDATDTALDNCGIKEAALFIRNAGIPALVNGIVSGIQTELLRGIGTPNGLCDPNKPTLLCGAGQLSTGGGELVAGINKLADGVVQLSEGGAQLSAGANELAAGLALIDAGAGQLADGTGELNAGADKLNAGAGRLADGAGQLADGTSDLKAGVGRLADGSVELADGAGQLADGTGQAKDGADQIADGAGELAQGLGDAANGSSQITDGLETAAEGAPKLVDGAERLSNEGTKKLVEAGVDTAQNYGQMYATIQAGAERAEAEKMAYGAPEGAMGLTAYSFVIEGEDGEGGRNLARGLAGLAVLGAGAGAFALRRRFI